MTAMSLLDEIVAATLAGLAEDKTVSQDLRDRVRALTEAGSLLDATALRAALQSPPKDAGQEAPPRAS